MSKNKNLKRAFGLIGTLFILFGVLPITLGIWNANDAVKFKLSATKIQAEVIELIERRNNSTNYSHGFSPKIKFQDDSGKDIIITSNTFTYPPDYSVGDTVNIFYNPKQPKTFKFDSVFDLWGFPLLCFIVGIGFITMGLLIIILGPILLHSLYAAFKELVCKNC